METPIYTKHTLEELVNAYSEVKGDAEFADYFIEQYNLAFDDYIINDDEEDIPPVSALKSSLEYNLPIFLEQLKKGHSAKWAHDFSTSREDDEDSTIYNTYHLIKEIDSLWAQNELIILCKSLGITDPMQVNFYINLIDNGVHSEKGIQRSETYLDIFKRELAKGMSFLYSNIYANERLRQDSDDTYCRAYAWAVEQTLLKNKSEKFRERFVHEFAEVIAENYHDLEQAMNNDDFYFDVNPIIASAQANDYIETHEVENPEKFRTLYVDIFQNFNALDQSPLLQIEKDIDEEVLKLTLEKMEN